MQQNPSMWKTNYLYGEDGIVWMCVCVCVVLYMLLSEDIVAGPHKFKGIFEYQALVLGDMLQLCSD